VQQPKNALGGSLSFISLGLALALTACSGGGSGGGTMYIETCTLGCGSGQGGTQVSCQFNQAAVNQEIAIFFSEPVDPSSISSSSFEIVDVSSGASPNGTRFRDPNNPNKVLFRPTVSFEDDGSISFGFDPNATYRVLVPGVSQGDNGPFIQSVGGARNESRLSCDIRTSQPAVDVVPGAPSVMIFVKQAITSTEDPDDFIPNVLVTTLPIVMDVWRDSDIRFEFNDLMNPATLANPQTGQSAFVRIEVDLDGNLSTPDRTPVFGTFTVELDPILLKTTMLFTPLDGIPSSGSLDPLINPDGLPRQLVITVPNNLQDVAGNALANPQTPSLVPEYVEIPPLVLPDADGEDFDTNSSNEDASHSSAIWGAGKLTRGQGGGRGRLGELTVRAGTTLTLSTDNETFPLDPDGDHDILSNAIPGVHYVATDSDTWPTITVTDGAFEFTSLTIETGGRLRFEGDQPARVFVRGNVNILGVLDISGATPIPHNSTLVLGGPGGVGGPNGGRGGNGATRFDYGGTSMIPVGGVDVPTGQLQIDGERGEGVGRVDFIAAGFGGDHWPTNVPVDAVLNPPANMDLYFTTIGGSCLSAQTGQPGGGGGYATDGQSGTPRTPFANSNEGVPNLPPADLSGAGGPSSDSDIEQPGQEPNRRLLNFEAGNLRGGSGGGAGGASVFGTESSGFAGICLDDGLRVDPWRDHSGAGGGGAGGAIQIVCGGPSLSISGRVDAGGGDGGSSLAAVTGDNEEALLRPKRAVPGGGGSGGAVRIQARNFPTSAFSNAMPPRLDVSGGSGGINTLTSVGGIGGAGLLRLEGVGTLVPAATLVAALISPNDASVGTDAINILSIGQWAQPRVRPDAYSGSVSCWMRPEGNFFQIVFIADTPSDPDPDERYGWDMNVIYGPSSTEFSYRDPMNSPFGTGSIESVYPNRFDQPGSGSYLVVRFQGARAAGEVSDLCGLDLTTQVVEGSLTPWVSHPDQLNQFSPRPNLIRFAVIFDFRATLGNQQNQIQGITGLRIRTQPD